MIFLGSGDFNVILSLEENNGGLEVWNRGMIDFRDCLLDLGLVDLRSIGETFTWWNKSHNDPVYRKLDRVLVNEHWLREFPSGFSIFLPRGHSDHSHVITKLGIQLPLRKKTFPVL